MTGLQPNVFAAISITWAAALTALVLRVVARRMTKMAWWFDDYFCVSAFVSSPRADKEAGHIKAANWMKRALTSHTNTSYLPADTIPSC